MSDCVRNSLFVVGLVSAGILMMGCGDKQTTAKTKAATTSQSTVKQTTAKTPTPQKSAVSKSGASAKDKPATSTAEAVSPTKERPETQNKPLAPKAAGDYAPPSRAQLLGTWRCVTEQPLMTLKTNETFLSDQLVKSEGNIAFQIPEGLP